jgi:hypothetical protein
VYGKAHRVSEDVTIQPGLLKALKRILRTICISTTPSKRLGSSKFMFSIPRPPSYMGKERNVRVLDPKGLVGKYLRTHDLDTSPIIVLNL